MQETIDKPAKHPGGRPSTYDQDVADRICQLLASGKSIRQALLEPGMPDRNTVFRWADAVPQFCQDLARAREDCADWHADHGTEVLQSAWGQSKDIVSAAREIARHHLSLAKVVDPRRYGEKVEVEHSGAIQGGLGPVIIQITAHQPAQAAQVIECQAVQAALPNVNDSVDSTLGK